MNTEQKFNKSVLVNTEQPTYVYFSETISFILIPKHYYCDEYTFNFKEIKGDFRIVSIKVQDKNISFGDNKSEKSFTCLKANKMSDTINVTIEIIAKVEYKRVNFIEVLHQLHISHYRMVPLCPLEYLEDIIILQGYEHEKLKCQIKKIDYENAEICILNPKKFYINGQHSHFRRKFKHDKDFNFTLSFVFDPTDSKHSGKDHNPENKNQQIYPKKNKSFKKPGNNM